MQSNELLIHSLVSGWFIERSSSFERISRIPFSLIITIILENYNIVHWWKMRWIKKQDKHERRCLIRFSFFHYDAKRPTARAFIFSMEFFLFWLSNEQANASESQTIPQSTKSKIVDKNNSNNSKPKYDMIFVCEQRAFPIIPLKVVFVRVYTFWNR